MDSTGGFIATVIERTRAYLDDASLDAKYDDNYLVRNIISPAFASVASRINNSTTNSISVWIPFPLQKGKPYYQLPPCVGEVWRLGVRTDDDWVSSEAMPRTEWHYRGPNWKVEGNMMVFSPTPDQDYDDLELQFIHNGEIQPFRMFSTTLIGSLSSVLITGTEGQFSCTPTNLEVGQQILISGTQSGSGNITSFVNPSIYYVIATGTSGGLTTFQLSSTYKGPAIATTAGTTINLTFTSNANTITFPVSSIPTVGTIDKRDSAYVGSIVRVLSTGQSGVQEERIISGWSRVGTNWQVTTRRPFSNIVAGSVTNVEFSPFGLESLYEAAAIGAALKLAVYKQVKPAHFQMLQLQYKDAMKTAMDHFSNKQMRTGKYFERNTADNSLNNWRNI